MQNTLSKFWWLVLPLAFMAFQIAIEVTLPSSILAPLHSESGPHELLQFIAMALATVFAARILLRLDSKKHPWIAGWALAALLGCLYVAGEEVSWGQHFLNWNTPEYWAALNDQQETNLHNVSSWLDQKPRALLEIGVVIGGLLIPLLRRIRPGALPARFAVIYPPSLLALIALCAELPKMAVKIGEAMQPPVKLFERVSEVNELYIYYFIALYLLLLYRQLRDLGFFRR